MLAIEWLQANFLHRDLDLHFRGHRISGNINIQYLEYSKSKQKVLNYDFYRGWY